MITLREKEHAREKHPTIEKSDEEIVQARKVLSSVKKHIEMEDGTEFYPKVNEDEKDKSETSKRTTKKNHPKSNKTAKKKISKKL